MENRYAGARREAERSPEFVDLIGTNFHNCGFRYPPTVIHAATDRYFTGADEQQYRPDPAGDPALRAAIVAYYRDAGVAVAPDSVVVTASASESYSHIFASRCGAGNRVLLPRPGYPMFEDIAVRNGLTVDFYDQRRSVDWRIDPDQLEAVLRPQTAAIVLISPNNPTGSVVSEATIRRVGGICERHDLFLVVDEVFSAILFTGSPLPRPAPLLPNLLVYTINGVSKLFASPELKVSWIAVSGPTDSRSRIPTHSQAVEDLLVQNDLFLSASSMSQFIVTEMFAGGMEFSRTMAAEIAGRRELMLGEIERIEGLSTVPTEGGIHLPVAIDPDALPAGTDDEEVAVQLLLNHRVAIHPGYLYGMDQPVTLVMSYLVPEDQILEGMSRIECYLKAPKR